MADPRFPGDRGYGADVPLENAAREDMAAPDTNFFLRQIKPPRVGPRMPQDIKPPALVQKIGTDLPPLTGDPGKDLPPLTGDLSKDVGVRGPLTPTAAPVAGATERTGIMRTLLGPGGPESRAKGGVSPFAAIARMLGAEEGTAQKAGQFERSLQASLAMPWASGAGAGAMGIRALQGAGLGAAEGAGEGLKGMGTRALAGAGTSLGGDIAAKGLRSLFSLVPHKLFSEKSGKGIETWLRQNIPAWKGEKNLYEMARGSGAQVKLSDAYAKGLEGAAAKVPAGTTIEVAADVAKKIGIPGGTTGPTGQVLLDAQKLLAKLPSLTKDQNTRRTVLDALHQGLPEGAVPDAAFREYALGKGWMDFAKKAGLFKKGEEYNAELAQTGLRAVGKETLGRRGMGDVEKIIRGPLAKPIKKETGRTAGSLIGGTVGALTGAPLGGIGAAGGATGGALGGGFLGGRLPIYRNVPETLPQIGQIRRSLLQALTQQMLQNQRSTGQ